MRFHRRSATAATVVALITGACVISSTTLPLNGDKQSAPGTVVQTPVRAHLLDGSIVIFAQGVTFGSDRTISGVGVRYDPTLTSKAAVASLPLDSVVGFEVYDRRVNPGRTVLYSAAATAGTIVGSVGLAVAIFGSCPTIYADSAGVETLQAESFSYSIAPLLEKRDVDRLRVHADSNGVVRLVVKNEALESHYLDQLELVELRHRVGELALPAPRGLPIAVSDIVPASSVRDAAGRDVRPALAFADGVPFTTDSAVLDRAIAGGATDDHLDITVPRRADRDSVAIVMRARASLLTSATLYDYMLARPGPAALDWLGRDLGRITTVAQVARWYAGNFGMRVQVLDHGDWRQVVRLMDFGPTAWRDVGITVPAIGGDDDSVRIRISFAADEFHIDRIAIAWNVRQLDPVSIPIARVFDRTGAPVPDAVRLLARADDERLVTSPGERFTSEFDVGVAAPGTRTYMIAAQGYYTEWIRPGWFSRASPARPFSPSRLQMREVLQSWRAAKDTLEQRFFVRRVPVA